MSNVFEEVTDFSEPRMNAWQGIVAKTVTDFADLLEITIPGLDPNLRWTNCKWQARNSIDLPERGYKCLAIFDDNDQIWVVAWWPF